MVKRPPSAPTPAIAALQRAGIEHRVHAFEHAPGNDEGYGLEAARHLGVTPDRVLKTLVCEVDGQATVAIVPVDATADLKAVAAAVGGKRARMLAPRDAERVTGYVTGGISPFGQRTMLPTVVDEQALAPDTVFVSAGRRGLEVEVTGADLVTATAARIAAICGRRR